MCIFTPEKYIWIFNKQNSKKNCFSASVLLICDFLLLAHSNVCRADLKGGYKQDCSNFWILNLLWEKLNNETEGMNITTGLAARAEEEFLTQGPTGSELAQLQTYYTTPVEAPKAVLIGIIFIVLMCLQMLVFAISDVPSVVKDIARTRKLFEAEKHNKVDWSWLIQLWLDIGY